MGWRWFLTIPLAAAVTSTGCAGLPRPGPPALADAGQLSPRPRLYDPLGNLEKSLLFYPTKYPQGNWQPSGLVFEDAWFEAADGTRLHGWYVPHNRPRAVALYCHGNAGHLADRAPMLRILNQEIGLAVMIFDYRGYGRSEGDPSEAGILADARAARAWLAQRAGVDESEIVLIGRSLGGGVAVDLAAADGARGLVLESTFSSVPDVASAMFRWFPAGVLVRTRLDSAAKIGRYHSPLLQSHGDADSVIPYELGLRLHEAANQPKQFITIPGGDHNDPQTHEYYRALTAFLDRLP